MIQFSTNNALNGAILQVINPETKVVQAVIYAGNPEDGIPGTISWDSSKGIHPDYIDEIERALQDAWRIAKGYIQIL